MYGLSTEECRGKFEGHQNGKHLDRMKKGENPESKLKDKCKCFLFFVRQIEDDISLDYEWGEMITIIKRDLGSFENDDVQQKK